MKNLLLYRLFFIGIIAIIAAMPIIACAETAAERDARMKWWRDARFGMFIHWGLYAMPARHEWVKNRERMTDEQYRKYFELFDPDLYNPREWAKMAKAAGMKYAVLTTKHHEGFCLFDSKFTDYKSTNTPCRRDLAREFVDAFRAEGLKIGFYYSLLDWHHPDYAIDSLHPQRQNSDGEYDRLNQDRDMSKYREYLKNQVRELLTNYGEISIMWFDYSFPGKHGKGRTDWDSEGLLKLVRTLQPGIIVNNRLDLPLENGGGDFETPEQTGAEQLRAYRDKGVSWETCQTFSGSWGYYRDENTWKTNSQLLELLITSVGNGGNLLLNVGPTGRGKFDSRAKERLGALAAWMRENSRSIYNCGAAPSDYAAPEGTLLTYNPGARRLYMHCRTFPLPKPRLVNMADKVEYVQFLHDASEIQCTREKNDLILIMPNSKPSAEIPVVEIFLK